MTDPTIMTPAERNTFMMNKIRSVDPAPYREGSYVLRVVATVGRVTGHWRHWPIAITQLDNNRYLCSPNRVRNWARNLLAAEFCDIEGDEPTRHDAALYFRWQPHR